MHLCSDATAGSSSRTREGGGVGEGGSSRTGEGRGGGEGGSGEHGLPQLHLVDVCHWTKHLQWVTGVQAEC